jgi:transposase
MRIKMSNKRRNFSSSFKSKNALEAIRGELTLVEISSKHGVHQSQVATWKKQALDGMSTLFSSNPVGAKAKHDKQITDLHAKIGELLVEKDFLLKAFDQ